MSDERLVVRVHLDPDGETALIMDKEGNLHRQPATDKVRRKLEGVTHALFYAHKHEGRYVIRRYAPASEW